MSQCYILYPPPSLTSVLTVHSFSHLELEAGMGQADRHTPQTDIQTNRHTYIHTDRRFDTTCTFSFTFGVDGQSRPVLRLIMFSPMHNPNTTKGQENLLAALANRRRVVGLTLPNYSGSTVCATIMEYLDTI